MKKDHKPATGAQPHDTPPRKRRKIVLSKVSHVRAELSRLYSEARNGELDIADASRLGNLLSILHKIIADSDLEQRLDKLEKNLKGEYPHDA